MKVKELKNGKEMILGEFRCIFPKLKDPTPFQGQTEEEIKHSIKILIPKSDKETLKNITTNYTIAIDKTNWSGAVKQQAKKMAKDQENGYNDNCILKDGDLINQKYIDQEKEPIKAYEGHYVLGISRLVSWGPINVVDIRGDRINPDLINAEIQSGYWVKIHCYTRTFKASKQGVTITLLGVQKIKEDDIFGKESPFENEAEIDEVDEDTNPFDEGAA